MLLLRKELYLHGSVIDWNWQNLEPTLKICYSFKNSIVFASIHTIPFDTKPFTKFASDWSDIAYCTYLSLDRKTLANMSGVHQTSCDDTWKIEVKGDW